MKEPIRIGGAALNQTPIAWESNLANILEAIAQGKQAGVHILCLPELCITGYGCEDLHLAPWLSEQAQRQLPAIIEATQGITVVVGLPLWHGQRVYNCACIIQDQRILGFYAKQNLANEGVHYEPRWFSAWPSGQQATYTFEGAEYPIGDVIIDLYGIKTGFEICEDAWTPAPKRPACRLYEQGVQLILNPSASHFAFDKSNFRTELFTSSSRNFNCVYVYTNLLGNEAGRMIYDGEVIIAQKGTLLAKNQILSFKAVRLVHTLVHITDPAQSQALPPPQDTSKHWELGQAAGLALYDYLRKSYSKGFVLSLSGGADSSCCAILVAEMVRRGIAELGTGTFLQRAHMGHLAADLKDKSPEEAQRAIMGQLLTTAYQGTVNSSADTLNAAQQLAESLGARFHQWTIDEEVTGYRQKIETALGRQLTWAQDDIALQNIQARARSPIIWMLANIHNALLLTTSNRSEGDVGYATMDGDTSGSIAPVAGIDKHFLLQWLQWAQQRLGYEGLNPVNQLQPTAELRPPERMQRDEDDLMPYPIIVAIEKLAIGQRQSPVQVFEALAPRQLEDNALLKAHIAKFFRLWSRNQWKRERIAPSFHYDDFNVDPRSWCRFPILSGGFQAELKALEHA